MHDFIKAQILRSIIFQGRLLIFLKTGYETQATQSDVLTL